MCCALFAADTDIMNMNMNMNMQNLISDTKEVHVEDSHKLMEEHELDRNIKYMHAQVHIISPTGPCSLVAPGSLVTLKFGGSIPAITQQNKNKKRKKKKCTP